MPTGGVRRRAPGFGEEARPELVEIIPRAEWSEAEKMSVGNIVTRTAADGATQNYFVTAMDADSITIDRNHPLAGKTVRFQGKVVSIRAATAEELASV